MCIYDACVEVPDSEGANIHRIKAGRYACYEYKGNIDNLLKVFNDILSIWLPFSGYDIDNKHFLEHYLDAPDWEGNTHVGLYIPII